MIQFLLKGLWRDPSRSLFPFLTVVAGVTLTVLLQTVLGGFASDLSWSSARFSTGHVKVTSRAYAKEGEQASNELAYVGVEKLLGELRQQLPEFAWAPRIRISGLLDIPDEHGQTKAQAPIGGLAIELLSKETPDRRALNLETALVRGRIPAASGEVLVSDDLARSLSVPLGATATLIGSTMYGAMATSNFTIVGTMRFGIRAMDRGFLIADIRDVQRALEMDDAASEIFGYFPDTLYRKQVAEATASRFNEGRASQGDEFAPTMVAMSKQPGTMELLDILGIYSGAIVGAFTFVMSIVLWNAGLVASLRRYGEIGVRLAFGEAKGHLYRAMIVESLAIGLVGSVIGTLLAMGPAYWLQTKGWDFSNLMQNATLMMSLVLRAQITPVSLFIGFLPGLLATGIGTAISGAGVYKRQTASLMKELEI
jgi:putative ABC transport system permease protein